jgi:HEPN domain-containing protein
MMAKESPSTSGLKKLARDRLRDAKTLFDTDSYHGAIYLAGYAVELALKSRICQHLGWEKLDESMLKRHELKFLLRFTGLESKQESFIEEWNLLSDWNPEMRYNASEDFQKDETRKIIDATEQLMEIFL